MRVKDLVFVNGKIYQTPFSAPVEAIRISGGRIISLGTNTDACRKGHDNCEIVDLKGRTALPGLIDSHNHMMTYGLLKEQINCGIPEMKIPDFFEKTLKEYATLHKDRAWIRGYNFDESRFRDIPDKIYLDRLVSRKPLILIRTCTHSALLNSSALESLGLDSSSKEPRNGKFGRAESGELNGWLYEEALENALVVISRTESSDIRSAVKSAQEDYLALGLTGVHDPGTDMISSRSCLDCYLSLERGGNIKIRTYLMARPDQDMHSQEWMHELCQLRRDHTFRGSLLTFGGIKLFADGSIGSRTAALCDPYEDERENNGILKSPSDIKQWIERIHNAGFQVIIHAIGDRAIGQVIESFAQTLSRFPRRDHRHRIEHCEMCSPPTIERIKNLGLLATFQPGFVYEFGDDYIRALGMHRSESMIACRDFYDSGFLLPMGTDAPILNPSPWQNMWVAAVRKTREGSELGSSQAISLRDAMDGYTRASSFAGFFENETGTLAVGKAGDMTVVEEDPFLIPIDDLPSIPISCTVVGGQVLFSNGI